MLIFLRVTISFKSSTKNKYLKSLPGPSSVPAVAGGLDTMLALEEDLPFS